MCPAFYFTIEMKKAEYIYGMNPVFELLRAGRRKTTCVYVDTRLKERQRTDALLRCAEERNVPVEWKERGRLIDMCDSRENQGVVAQTTEFPYADSTLLNDISRVLVIDNVEDPHNIGALIRTAEVVGFEAVVLPIKGTPGIYASVVKAAAGATEYIPIIRDGNTPANIRAVKNAGLSIASLDMKGQFTLLEYAKIAPQRLALVIGGESKGVGHYVLRQSDAVVYIPQKGRVTSLNASVAGAIAMSALI